MELQNYILKNKFLKIITLSVILLYLIVPIYLAQHVINMHHSDHMNHTANTECIYNVGENGLCGMDLFNSLYSWQNSSNLFLPFILLIYVSVLFTPFANFLRKIYLKQKIFLYFKKQRHRIINTLFQKLFSHGILNPKLF